MLAIVQDYFLKRRWLLAACVVLGVVWALQGSQARNEHLGKALSELLEPEGIVVKQDSVLRMDPPKKVVLQSPILFLGKTNNEAYDLYYATVREGGSGQLWDLSHLRNLTRTSSADESMLRLFGHFAAYASRVGDGFDAVTVLDLRGEGAKETAWPWFARLQNAISNYQEFGRFEGFGKTRFQLSQASKTLRLYARKNHLLVANNDQLLELGEGDLQRDLSVHGLVRRPTEKAQPGLITWLVDTVRKVSWIGPAPIEWLEHRVF
ncbi:MAG: hypothetical protein IPJ88_11765 [Myxococcales bacterium]|nr:MAG: hypothetical protein IPJ88_11765 [Myxococcales bacterium]